MAWIPAAIVGITTLIGMGNQNAETAKANANNTAQQQAEVNNAKTAAQNAEAQMAPWLTAGATPFGKTSVANPLGPLALGPVPGQTSQPAPAPAPVMQPPAQPQRRMTQPVAIGQPGPAPVAQPPPLNPLQIAQVQQIMHAPRTVNTAPVAL